jgi:diaminopimelate decarboxylase
VRKQIFLDAAGCARLLHRSRRHPVASFPSRRGPAVPIIIAGPLGTDLDVFIRRARIVRPREGDVVVIGAVGAYNLIAANEWAGPIPRVISG